ncbi:MAG: ABC transporter permease [Phycisphaerae bacterium]
MYKLFLSLRYLRSKVLAYFAVLSVALCVFMLLLVVSVMNGFLEQIEAAAKGLHGDIVVESNTLSGLGRYDKLSAELEKVEHARSASPFILTFGILRMPGTDYRQTVQVAGIRLPERAHVSDFEKGLFVQKDVEEPTWDPPLEKVLERLRSEISRTQAMLDTVTGDGETDLPPEKADLARRLRTAISFQSDAAYTIERAAEHRDELREIQQRLSTAPAGATDEELIELSERRDALIQRGIHPPRYRMILGLGIPGLSFRSEDGRTVRLVSPGHEIELVLAPLGRRLAMSEVAPNRAMFTVIDDCTTDVWSVDKNIVYVPFETLQELNNMAAEYSADDPSKQVIPARCSAIHVKVDERLTRERDLRPIRDEVHRVVARFQRDHPDAMPTGVSVQTWRQRQQDVIAPIEKQRTLTVIMFSIMSTAMVFLILVIFYSIVVQKTREIGLLKAVGATHGGVAGIFLGYGIAVGVVGSIIGTVGGYYFVRNINPIQDWVDSTFGFRVWERDVFMFEQIPNEMDWTAAALVVAGAIVAGLLGAIIPAIRAARMQPVEALRYE